MLRRFIDFISSLKLTVICLCLAIVLVFAGTMAQVNFGIHEVQQRYFQSLLIWWPNGPHAFKIPVFPGGHLLAIVLLVNLIAAHVRRFRWTWSKLGIQLTHAGLIVMLAGVLLTDMFSVESFMRLAPGETKNYSESPRDIELAVIDGSDKTLDQVTAIPGSRLKDAGSIDAESLPFQIVVRRFYQNSRVQPLDQAGPGASPASTAGSGTKLAVTELPRATAQNDRDIQSVVIEIVPKPAGGQGAAQPLDTWLVSDQPGVPPQTLSHAGKTWQLVIRQQRHYKPFSLTLRKFTHERYAGTQIPKNFASHAMLNDPERNENRDVLIYMNHPLRYRGETFFQSGFEENDAATILQDVYNPSFMAPYAACIIVAAGLLFQFGYHFFGFIRRRKTSHAQ